ncbi:MULTISPECIES: DUF2603 domain-containing protein [Campylobacter]|uniref:UPF0763 protein BVH53_06140 n=1 Tax=Campylobacter fetus TaxID=196 RepID=A0A7U7ZTU9_CAMFE|nr:MULTISPECIES: DUF2603 domain-containing protein [Campylobacter]AIR79442.1 hypothetical protein (DUF2603 domain) [Campylobacter fetus subsp. fetus 04/554]EAI4415204.1 DUF2603 domain-containing protein [Campylobacter fetus]EAI5408276.1 DUF2603 domain-containing protein [Campylobacter fetus]EAJ0327450.1 DUF2603 domain-containing protein [Campylobacter fetus]EAJ1230762.1 DUF2603 domain-containing protein [Campylobacter fetus]
MNNERLDNISNSLGISKRKRTLFELEQISDNEMKLIIKNGKLNLSVPWFGMSGNTPCALVPAGLFEAIINTLKNAQKENFELKLEKSIWQHIPVDFGDVWSVAIDEIKKSKFKKEPNLDRVVKKIKKEHPNLFVDMQSLIQSKEN